MNYEPFSRRQLRARFRTWAVGNLKILSWILSGGLTALGLATLLIVGLGSGSWVMWYSLGVIHALAFSGAVSLIVLTFFAIDREAIFHIRGAWGEDNTRTELGRAKRKGIIWDWVDSVDLQAGDIDHLVVTKEGGVVAIDSKWRNRADPIDQAAMVHAAQKVSMRATGVVQTLIRPQRSVHRLNAKPAPVTSVVVLWGAVQSNVPEDACIDGIEFIAGRSLLRWLGARSGEPIDRDAAEDLIRRIEGFRASASSPG